ncbi:hypothetical protein Fbal_1252 [Ferrimonas balearica DSM 9799]|uniref:Uncharacterized protein n=1 Tax=Ferrimonas balearica (strain DSM 9799 / CCM 4581 / KCTC 23876 / PAT) TaxID=550540 RepID=E1SL83_FERBD|nr:hypothetical protein Fbal_1252 [Ferrimonas balearica DSM 9799]
MRFVIPITRARVGSQSASDEDKKRELKGSLS